MAAYLIVRVTVTDAEKYGEYVKHSPRILDRFGGKFIARGGEVTTLEGPEETNRVVIIEYPDVESAKAMYESEEYGLAKALREGAGEAQFIVINGLEDGAWEAFRDASKLLSFDS